MPHPEKNHQYNLDSGDAWAEEGVHVEHRVGLGQTEGELPPEAVIPRLSASKRALSVKERPAATLPLRPGLAPNALRERPTVASTAIFRSLLEPRPSVRLHPGVAERRQQLQQRHQGGTPVRTSGGNRGCSTPCAMPSSARNKLGIHEEGGHRFHTCNAPRDSHCPRGCAFGSSL